MMYVVKHAVPAYDKATAEANRAHAARYLRLQLAVEHCEDCDAYHVALTRRVRSGIDEHHRRVLEKICMGLRDSEIAEDMGLTMKQVEHSVTRLTRKLNAYSRPNLVAIAVGLGLVNPMTFMSRIEEKRSHGKRA